MQSGAVGEGLPLLKQAADRDPRDRDMQYHYAAALAKSGKATDAQERLRALLGGTEAFSSRADAQKLLASLNKSQP